MFYKEAFISLDLTGVYTLRASKNQVMFWGVRAVDLSASAWPIALLQEDQGQIFAIELSDVTLTQSPALPRVVQITTRRALCLDIVGT